jgi:hypothetical protein
VQDGQGWIDRDSSKGSNFLGGQASGRMKAGRASAPHYQQWREEFRIANKAVELAMKGDVLCMMECKDHPKPSDENISML